MPDDTTEQHPAAYAMGQAQVREDALAGKFRGFVLHPELGVGEWTSYTNGVMDEYATVVIERRQYVRN